MRNPHIGSQNWAKGSPGRFGVVNMGLLWGGNFEPDESCWAVMNDRGEVLAKADGSTRFPTHAEAITYATEHATRQALAARFTIPPENPVARAIQETPC